MTANAVRKRRYRQRWPDRIREENAKRSSKKIAWAKANRERVNASHQRSRKRLMQKDAESVRKYGRDRAQLRRSRLTDGYVLQVLFGDAAPQFAGRVPASLIETQRTLLTIKRLCRNLKTSKH